MGKKSFGNLFKELRLKKGQTLRRFCEMHNFDPGNISKLERGKLSPPVDPNILEKYAHALNLVEGSEDWNEFIILAATESHRIPDQIVRNNELLNRLPILFRTITGEKVSIEKLDLLIKMLQEE